MANDLRMVTLGDSVPWGQGLREVEKYDAMVRDALERNRRARVSLERLAHSGAVISAHRPAGDPAPGEVPTPRPTIVEQCDSYASSPETVDVVLVNGGINDVGIATILNPFALVPSLDSRIRAACHTGMLALLRAVSAKFTKPSCKILVTGYYAILSGKSDPGGTTRLLGMHGIARPAFVEAAEFFNPVINRCGQFFSQSTAQLELAVVEANDRRIAFVPSGFTDDNAAFVRGTSFLFGLDPFLNPQDAMAAERHAQCDIVHRDPLETVEREVCYRASAGHPNPAGAIQFKNQVIAALGG